jgi:Uma2 family endonuclease
MPKPEARYTPAEYLEMERHSETRHEYLDGEIFAMGGASRRHNLISLNIAAELRAGARGRPCEVYAHDMRVRIEATGLYTYPDVVAVCGEPRFEDMEVDTLLNPTCLAEVLSKSTEDYDRGAKFEGYRTVPSLREVLLVAQDRPHIVHYLRQPDGSWLLSEIRDPEGTLTLASLACELRMAEVYARVEFGE